MDLENRKLTNLCIVGNGEWGSKILEIAKLISRFNIVGVIDSKTNDNIKTDLLEKSDLVYIATNPEHQINYVNYCLSTNKDVMCESPFLCSKEQRESVYQEILNRPINTSLFFINYPYLLDPAFSNVGRTAASKDFTFLSIKSSGPRFQNNPERAKKFYSNHAINIIIQIMATKTHKFDKFIMHDDYIGEFFYRDSVCLFSWGHSDIPMLEVSVKGKDFALEKKLTYDQYDTIAPLFQFYLMAQRGTPDSPTMPRSLSINTLQHCIHSEYFSDLFVATQGRKIQSTYEKLIFSGNLIYDKSSGARQMQDM